MKIRTNPVFDRQVAIEDPLETIFDDRDEEDYDDG